MCVSKNSVLQENWRLEPHSLTHSLTWLDLEPNSPATTSSSASKSVAARTFCKSCCCSSFIENANSSSSMPASFVMTCKAETSRRYVPLFSLPWPYPTFPWFTCSGHFPPLGPVEQVANSGELLWAVRRLATGAAFNRNIINDCKAGKVKKIPEKSAQHTAGKWSLTEDQQRPWQFWNICSGSFPIL